MRQASPFLRGRSYRSIVHGLLTHVLRRRAVPQQRSSPRDREPPACAGQAGCLVQDRQGGDDLLLTGGPVVPSACASGPPCVPPSREGNPARDVGTTLAPRLPVCGKANRREGPGLGVPNEASACRRASLSRKEISSCQVTASRTWEGKTGHQGAGTSACSTTEISGQDKLVDRSAVGRIMPPVMEGEPHEFEFIGGG